jgi:branched-chain amino acid transport system substrate-binding protein
MGALVLAPGSGASRHIRSSAGAYNVAIIGSVTGTDAETGVSGVNGAETVFDVANAAGGIDGHHIKYQVYDDQSSADTSQTVARQALGTTPTVVIDASSGTYINARLPVYTQAQLPVISTRFPINTLSPWLFTAQTTQPQANYVYQQLAISALGGTSLQGKKIALVVLANPGGIGAANGITPLIQQAGGTVVSSQTFELGGTNFDAGAANVVNSGADLAFVLTTTADTIVCAKALLNAGFKGPIIAAQTAADPLTMNTINSSQFMSLETIVSPRAGGVMAKAATQYKHTQGLSLSYFSAGWGVAYAIVLALHKCTYPCSASSFDQALESLGPFNVPGNALANGKWKVNAKLHNFQQFAILVRWNTTTKAIETVGKKFPVGPPGYSS